MRTPALFLLVLAGCGYALAARPGLPGGLERVSVPIFENRTAETEVGSLLTRHLASRAEADDRLGGEGAGRLVGRVEALPVSPVAFPSQIAGAGLYQISLRVRARLLPAAGEGSLREVVVSGDEPFLAGRGPEETEANRRRALERLAARLAEELWSRLTE